MAYLSFGTESRRMFVSQEPTVRVDQFSAKALWDSLDNTFTKQRNITFDRYTFLTQKQLTGVPVKKSYGRLRELFLIYDLGSHEESMIRDVFITNTQDGEIQRELLKITRTPRKP